jgi:aspartyl-tRNA(Asn)/glutamyl-tRNA(Gln) amidotransferase subunit C
MSKIGIEEVKRLAALARISLSDEQVAELAVELGQIVEFVQQLQQVDVKQVEPTNQVTGLVDVTRRDEVKPLNYQRELWQSNLPASQDGYIKVKRVQE